MIESCFKNPFKLLSFFIYLKVISLFCAGFIYPPPLIHPYTINIHYFPDYFYNKAQINCFYALTTDMKGG